MVKVNYGKRYFCSEDRLKNYGYTKKREHVLKQ